MLDNRCVGCPSASSSQCRTGNVGSSESGARRRIGHRVARWLQTLDFHAPLWLGVWTRNRIRIQHCLETNGIQNSDLGRILRGLEVSVTHALLTSLHPLFSRWYARKMKTQRFEKTRSIHMSKGHVTRTHRQNCKNVGRVEVDQARGAEYVASYFSALCLMLRWSTTLIILVSILQESLKSHSRHCYKPFRFLPRIANPQTHCMCPRMRSKHASRRLFRRGPGSETAGSLTLHAI